MYPLRWSGTTMASLPQLLKEVWSPIGQWCQGLVRRGRSNKPVSGLPDGNLARARILPAQPSLPQ